MKTNRWLKRLGALALAAFLVGLAGFPLLSEKAFVDTRAAIAAAPPRSSLSSTAAPAINSCGLAAGSVSAKEDIL